MKNFTKSKKVKLGNLVKVKSDFVDGPFGSSLKVSDQTESGVRLIQVNNIGINKFRDSIKRYTSESKFHLLKKHDVKSGDIVIAKMGDPLGRACEVPEFIDTALVVADCMRLRLDKRIANKRYVLWYINSPYAKLKLFNLSKGSTRVRVNLSMFRELEIPLPSLETQKKIAEVLDKADAIRQRNRQILEQYDDLAQSIFLDMFGDPGSNPKGWDLVNLSSVIEEGPQNGLYKPSKDYGSGVPIIRIDSFYNGVVDLSKLKRVRLSESEIQKYKVQEGEVLINRVNSRSHLGKVGLVPALDEDVVFESNMMRIHFDSGKANSIYMLLRIRPLRKMESELKRAYS